MATIPASAIVSVTPSVISAGGTAQDLIGLMLTATPRIPVGSVQSFATAASVSTTFGPTSPEVALATVYFNGFDNSNKKPGAMLFAQYPWIAPVSAWLRGGSGLTLAQVKALSGSLSMVIDGGTVTASSIVLTGATSYSGAAALIQTALGITGPVAANVTGSITTTVLTVTAVASGTLAVGNVLSGTGMTAGTSIVNQLTGTTGGIGTYTVSASQAFTSGAIVATALAVLYDSLSAAFWIYSGSTGLTSTMAYATGTLAASLLLTQATSAVLSQGAAIAAPGAFMAALVTQTTNWASFMTVFEPVIADKVLFASWANSTTYNFVYAMWDTNQAPTVQGDTSSAGYLIGVAGYSGTVPIYQDINVAAFLLGAIASLDFTQINGRATMKFRAQAGITPTVTNQQIAANLTANGYNYYGAWATANNGFSFFSEGTISGIFKWIDSFVNEIWMNNQFQLALMVLLTSVRSIPYNQAGYTQISEACAPVARQAVTFGAIRAGVTLSASQIAQVNANAGKKIDDTLSQRGWYIMVLDALPQVRAARGSPPMTFWYMDGGSIHKMALASIEVQ